MGRKFLVICFNFKAEVELKMPGSVVEIDII